MGSRGRLLLAATVIVAATIFGAGIAWAAIPGANGVISACYDRAGALRVIDAEAGDTCGRRESALAWNQTGPAGPTGPTGPSDAFVTTIHALSPLPGGVTETIASMDVPAGNYVISAPVRVRSQVIYNGGSLSCDLYGGGLQLDIFQVSYGPGESFEQQVAGLEGWVEMAAPGAIEVRCRADYQDVDLSTLGVFESPLTAIKVGSITVAP